MTREAKILSEKTNSAVVQLPDRRFPGLVIQGDTLKSWEETTSEAIRAMRDGNPEEAVDAIHYLHEKLCQHLRHYEKVLQEAGLPLPYAHQKQAPTGGA